MGAGCILGGEAGEALARLGATRGGERAGLTSRPEVCVGGGVVWGPAGIREAQICGFSQTEKTRRRRRRKEGRKEGKKESQQKRSEERRRRISPPSSLSVGSELTT
ncbi:Hypothetical predicted protein [Xyrichtys novacula]|uniref:Uncharacterized protein n=1 Tax=Xyrichtys novacula TaxID=13765 RepID=A0AAV1FR88_XYRNO|nr:Hypothetical predicted protein [Xyrichtys novacula]